MSAREADISQLTEYESAVSDDFLEEIGRRELACLIFLIRSQGPCTNALKNLVSHHIVWDLSSVLG
ncbi:MAG: hypothetical protein ACYCQJ_09955 [Nitrososphaerales archaeon]